MSKTPSSSSSSNSSRRNSFSGGVGAVAVNSARPQSLTAQFAQASTAIAEAESSGDKLTAFIKQISLNKPPYSVENIIGVTNLAFKSGISPEDFIQIQEKFYNSDEKKAAFVKNIMANCPRDNADFLQRIGGVIFGIASSIIDDEIFEALKNSAASKLFNLNLNKKGLPPLNFDEIEIARQARIMNDSALDDSVDLEEVEQEAGFVPDLPELPEENQDGQQPANDNAQQPNQEEQRQNQGRQQDFQRPQSLNSLPNSSPSPRVEFLQRLQDANTRTTSV